MSVLLVGGHGYLGSALRETLPEAVVADGDYTALRPADLNGRAWVIFLAHRKTESHADDDRRFRGFLAHLPDACRLLLVSSAAVHGQGGHAEKMRRRERAVAERPLTWVLRPGSVSGPAPAAAADSLLNRMVADARAGGRVRAGCVHRPILTTCDWARAVAHVVSGKVPAGTYELASFTAWMPALAEQVARRFAASVDIVPELGSSLDCRVDTTEFERTGFAFLDGLESAIIQAEQVAAECSGRRMTPLTACVCCGAADPRVFLDFGERPLANALRSRREDSEARYPLAVAECERCGHWQLTHAVAATEMFPADYPYRAGITGTTRAQFRELAATCASRIEGRRALEIGANDGTLLRALAEQGFAVRGVDPSPQTTEFQVSRAFWSPESAKTLFPDARFDLVCACNVLAHVARPREFLQAAAGVLAPGGLVVVEVTDGDAMLEKMRWSLIYHEHLSYFRDVGLTLLAARAGLRVEAIERVPVHGGSLRAWLSRRSSDAGQLRADVRRQIDALRASLGQPPRRVVGFGCPAKAALLIAELGVPFAYLADDTPAKIGKFCPGTNIEIRPLSALAAEPEAVTVVLLAWNQPRDFAAWMQRHRAGMGDAVVMV